MSDPEHSSHHESATSNPVHPVPAVPLGMRCPPRALDLGVMFSHLELGLSECTVQQAS
jgi:hypothetical protein